MPDFDLVRLYHPDKAGLSVSPEVAHAQFQAITSAYDALRGKTPLGSVPSTSGGVDSTYQSTAAWRAMRNRRQELYSSGAADDSWKDKIIVMGVVGVRYNFLLKCSSIEFRFSCGGLADDTHCRLRNYNYATRGHGGGCCSEP